MKRLEEFRSIHKGTIWIVGMGPSLLKYPKGFFGPPRIAIGLNAAYTLAPECKYFLSNHTWGKRGVEPEEGKREIPPEVLKRFIIMLVTVPTGFTEFWRLPSLEYAKKYFKEILAYGRWLGDPNAKKEEFQEVIEKIMAKKDCLLVQKGTVSHFGIQVAALMGAKKIILAGCEAKSTEGLRYAEKNVPESRVLGKEQPKLAQEGKAKQFIYYRNGAIWLANALKKHGVEVVRFDPETMKDEKIPAEDEKFSLQLGGSEDPFLFHELGYFLMDYPESRGTEIVSDFSKPFPFENNSIEKIIAFHSLCRLIPDEAVTTLWECNRVLVPDGRIVITVPEFAWICRSYLETGNLTPDLVERLYGHSYEKRLQYRNCFSVQNLFTALRSAGFKRFKMMSPKKFEEGFCDGIKGGIRKSFYRDGDLIVEAFKGEKSEEEKAKIREEL